jgi:hypothetical protein
VSQPPYKEVRGEQIVPLKNLKPLLLPGSKEQAMNAFRRLFGINRNSGNASKQTRRPALTVEALEERTLMSVASSLANVHPPVVALPTDAFRDGNFASPAQRANCYTYNPIGSPWIFDGASPNGSGVSASGSAFTSGNPSAPTAQVAFLQGHGQMSQSFELSAGSYSISFLAAQRGNHQTSFQAVEVWLDNTLVDLVMPASTSYAPYHTLNFTVTGTAVHNITFKGVDPLTGDNTAFVTNVTIGPAAAHADPNQPAVLTQTVADFQRDGSITYSDMLGLFATELSQIAPVQEIQHGTGKGSISYTGGLTVSQIDCLKTIVGDAACLKMAPDVTYLANNVVNGNAANASYQTLNGSHQVVNSVLGNLFATGTSINNNAGSSATQLQELVTKWFLGGDYPATVNGVAYTPTSGSLFVSSAVQYATQNGSTTTTVSLTKGNAVPNYWDVHQTDLGDCWLISSFAEAAMQNPAAIETMFTYEGNSVWSVRFYVNGTPTYVTVNAELPSDYCVAPAYTGAIWVQLAEKAYADVFAGNSYNSLNNGGGFSQGPMADITGRSVWASSFYHVSGVGVVETGATGVDTSTVLSTITSALGDAGDSNYVTSENHLAGQIYQAFASGQLVTLGSLGSGTNHQVAGNHMYFLVGAQAVDGTYSFTLGNPWGAYGGSEGNNSYPFIVSNVSVDDLFANFDYAAFTNSTGPASANTPPVSTTTGISGPVNVTPLAIGFGATQTPAAQSGCLQATPVIARNLDHAMSRYLYGTPCAIGADLDGISAWDNVLATL